ncbi:MAG: GGDEF domain-containing protein [Campylobacterales bacterium]|nr:GGDEF domain-containing protein [Campylobacterales bacterium]
MLYPQEKERSHRFLLALRTGLPLFSLTIILIFTSLSDYFQQIPSDFFIFAILILAVFIYFIFYMIYRGFDEQITDPITHTFTRLQVISLLKKEISRYKEYSILLISVENLSDINARYGIRAGDKVLRKVANKAGVFFLNKGFKKFPIGHFKGGDFIIGLVGSQNKIKPFLEMMCIKYDDLTMNEIEIKIKGSIVDTTLSRDVQALIERLFEAQSLDSEDGSHLKMLQESEDFSLLEFEQSVRTAIKERSFSLMFQPIKADEKMVHISIKLQGKNEEIIHQKTFMPLVKRLGYEREYDEIVLEKVLQVCTKIEKVTFAFNLSPSVLRNRHFVYYIKQKLAQSSEHRRLVIILSEKEVYGNMRRYNDLLQQYRELGLRFVLDNVGSLNASAEYIKRLDVDIIRFDKPFSRHLDSPAYRSLLHGYMQMCKELGMKSWIKMVDTQESKAYSEEMSIDYIQGHAVSKIVNLDKLEEELG